MLHKLSSFGTTIGDLWCQTVHSEPMWPVGGEYKCRQCQRSFKVPWEQPNVEAREPARVNSNVRVAYTAN